MFRWKKALGGRVLEESPHVHLHFPQRPGESNGIGLVEVCCHGCGVGQVVRYDLPASGMVVPSADQPELLRFIGDFTELHDDCRGKVDASDCSAHRTLVTSMDLREHPVLPPTTSECTCPCHDLPVEHPGFACCTPCRACGVRVAATRAEAHASDCTPAPVTSPEIPGAKYDPRWTE